MFSQFFQSSSAGKRASTGTLSSLEDHAKSGPASIMSSSTTKTDVPASPVGRVRSRFSLLLSKRSSTQLDVEQEEDSQSFSSLGSDGPPTPPPHRATPTNLVKNNGHHSLQLGEHVRQVLGSTLAEVDAEIEIEWAHRRNELRKSLQTPWRPIAAA